MRRIRKGISGKDSGEGEARKDGDLVEFRGDTP